MITIAPGNIFNIETDYLIELVKSVRTGNKLYVSSANGDDGAYEFWKIYDMILVFDDNLDLVFTGKLPDSKPL